MSDQTAARKHDGFYPGAVARLVETDTRLRLVHPGISNLDERGPLCQKDRGNRNGSSEVSHASRGVEMEGSSRRDHRGRSDRGEPSAEASVLARIGVGSKNGPPVHHAEILRRTDDFLDFLKQDPSTPEFCERLLDLCSDLNAGDAQRLRDRVWMEMNGTVPPWRERLNASRRSR